MYASIASFKPDLDQFLEIVSGLETIQRRRGQQTEKPILLTGPGKVGAVSLSYKCCFLTVPAKLC